MKRITGAFALLAGLSGCVAVTPTAQGDKKPADTKPAAVSTMSTMGTTPNGSMPAYSSWAAYPNPGALPPNTLAMSGTGAPLPALTPPGPGRTLPASLQPAALPDLRPTPQPTKTMEVPPGMPVVMTPASETGAARQASYLSSGNRTEAKLPEIVTDGMTEHPRPLAVPPTPTVKNSVAVPTPPEPSRTTRLGGAPLLRLVNTKRITLNFEVKDVGSSGLAGVDLWYTQDGRDWKKHEAPTNAQAYVVEVDEEGMYGFTLVAKSGIGLGKEPPAAGDQPQVWVIVDLSKPDVQLTEVAANLKSKQQSVAIKWTATDKNLGRQPVTLSYAETEEGPWHIIASNLECQGKYMWQIPANLPPRVLMRAEAMDLAGNVGRAQSAKPIVMDASMPRVSIVNVEANSSR